ncbi:hypothetical protein J5N97_015582 [Dioscorea zingiberensis]|uniref:EGF-like domain-containing protein n=1 Tax=Dioscorea zingiberensis TaxID=325984 RepID=A0A9D5CJE5_9LILI|nr:hypothetical protein J5N97_015582 [Dioscorea zingiberensis]
MEPANINWKRIESRFVRDEVYEGINAPKWADLSSPDHSVVDDEAWFCRPDCRHPKTADDFRRLSPSPKVKQMRSTPETLPLSQRNGNQRDGYLKRRGGIAALLSSSSFKEAPRPKFTSKKLHEDLENQDPNGCSKNTSTPPASCSKAVPKMVKEAIKSSSEKSREEVEEEWRHNKPAPRLRSTLSARNLFAGKDILGQISEFCQEIKKLIVMKERPSAAQEEVKKVEGMQKKVLEEAPKGLNTNSNMDSNSMRKGGLVKKKGGMVLRVEKVEEKCKKSADENSPLLKREAVRSCPPTPQRFPSPATRRLRNSKTSVVTSSPLKSKTPERGILRELVQQGSEEKKALVAMDENNASSVPDETEGRSLDISCSAVNGTGHNVSELLNGSSGSAIDFNVQFPADSHGAVAYRGAPWKPDIGKWLSGCGSVSAAIDAVENIGGKGCKDNCGSRGVCNHELGECRCFHGFAGEGCSVSLQFDCNHPGSQELPYGPFVVSICTAYCDKTRAMCFCGEGTKYPNRPLAEACGFKINLPTQPGGEKVTDWTQVDEDVFSTNSSKNGWCNVDPKEAYASNVKFKEECDCKYDGLWGQFCETPTLCSCINQCSENGHCRGGACECDSGWYGIDCSIPSPLSPMQEWPAWLRPSTIELPDKMNLSSNPRSVKALVKKKRPLIYVYELPPEFNSHLLEGRHFKFECVNRIYNDMNRTLWTEQLYGAQIALYESILASPHRTMNGEEADFFYVPALDSCIIVRAGDAPHLSLQEHMGLRSSLTLDYYKKAYEHIMYQYPYWNQSSGRDHIWFFSWDEGACYAPKEIWNSMMLVHWGNTNSKHNHSTTAYWGDNWDTIPSDKRGDHPCFDPKKDLVLPAWKRPDPGSVWLKLWARPREERTTLFYFNGNLGSAYEYGRVEDTYSMGIRQKVAEEFSSIPNKEGKLGRQHTSNVTVTAMRSNNYFDELASSIFCGVLPGDGWSGRMEDSILQGCIPVIIQDGIFLPYENVLNYKSFTVRIREDEIPNLIRILKSINETEIDFMLANVRKVWQRFIYRDSLLLEAQRQKNLFGSGSEEGWAVEYSKLEEDDVFSTFIQVLHYKLHNDPWRRQLPWKKKSGLPDSCLKTV